MEERKLRLRYLGLDLGEKTIGVALSESGIIASNLLTIRYKTNDLSDALNQFCEVYRKYPVDVVVIGLPKHMNNDIGLKAQYVLKFKEMLEDELNIKVETFDERMSTQSALKILSDNRKKYDKQRALKDEVAAQVILQNYLNAKGKTL